MILKYPSPLPSPLKGARGVQSQGEAPSLGYVPGIQGNGVPCTTLESLRAVAQTGCARGRDSSSVLNI